MKNFPIRSQRSQNVNREQSQFTIQDYKKLGKVLHKAWGEGRIDPHALQMMQDFYDFITIGLSKREITDGLSGELKHIVRTTKRYGGGGIPKNIGGLVKMVDGKPIPVMELFFGKDYTKEVAEYLAMRNDVIAAGGTQGDTIFIEMTKLLGQISGVDSSKSVPYQHVDPKEPERKFSAQSEITVTGRQIADFVNSNPVGTPFPAGWYNSDGKIKVVGQEEEVELRNSDNGNQTKVNLTAIVFENIAKPFDAKDLVLERDCAVAFLNCSEVGNLSLSNVSTPLLVCSKTKMNRLDLSGANITSWAVEDGSNIDVLPLNQTHIGQFYSDALTSFEKKNSSDANSFPVNVRYRDDNWEKRGKVVPTITFNGCDSESKIGLPIEHLPVFHGSMKDLNVFSVLSPDKVIRIGRYDTYDELLKQVGDSGVAQPGMILESGKKEPEFFINDAGCSDPDFESVIRSSVAYYANNPTDVNLTKVIKQVNATSAKLAFDHFFNKTETKTHVESGSISTRANSVKIAVCAVDFSALSSELNQAVGDGNFTSETMPHGGYFLGGKCLLAFDKDMLDANGELQGSVIDREGNEWTVDKMMAMAISRCIGVEVNDNSALQRRLAERVLGNYTMTQELTGSLTVSPSLTKELTGSPTASDSPYVTASETLSVNDSGSDSVTASDSRDVTASETLRETDSSLDIATASDTVSYSKQSSATAEIRFTPSSKSRSLTNSGTTTVTESGSQNNTTNRTNSTRLPPAESTTLPPIEGSNSSGNATNGTNTTTSGNNDIFIGVGSAIGSLILIAAIAGIAYKVKRVCDSRGDVMPETGDRSSLQGNEVNSGTGEDDDVYICASDEETIYDDEATQDIELLEQQRIQVGDPNLSLEERRRMRRVARGPKAASAGPDPKEDQRDTAINIDGNDTELDGIQVDDQAASAGLDPDFIAPKEDQGDTAIGTLESNPPSSTITGTCGNPLSPENVQQHK